MSLDSTCPSQLSSFLLLLGCAAAAWANPPAAIPNSDPAHQRAERSFHEFATGWMQKMERLESQNRAKPKLESQVGTTVASYRGYADDFQIELTPDRLFHRALGRHPPLQRDDLHVRGSARRRAAAPSKNTRVTEIFRFQGGKWIY